MTSGKFLLVSCYCEATFFNQGFCGFAEVTWHVAFFLEEKADREMLSVCSFKHDI